MPDSIPRRVRMTGFSSFGEPFLRPDYGLRARRLASNNREAVPLGSSGGEPAVGDGAPDADADGVLDAVASPGGDAVGGGALGWKRSGRSETGLAVPVPQDPVRSARIRSRLASNDPKAS